MEFDDAGGSPGESHKSVNPIAAATAYPVALLKDRSPGSRLTLLVLGPVVGVMVLGGVWAEAQPPGVIIGVDIRS